MRIITKAAGLLYLLQIPLGVFGLIYVPKTLVVAGDTLLTAQNILAHEALFRLSIVSALSASLLTLFTALSLYQLLKPVNKYIAKLMVLFAALAVPISMINELNNVAVLVLLKSSVISMDQMPGLLNLYLELHKYGIQIAGVFFGLWLLPMGYLVFKSKFIPRIIGLLLILTCFGYLVDFVTFFLFPNFGIVVSEYTWLGEVLMVGWLLTSNRKE